MFMFLDVTPSVRFLEHYRLKRIQCYANGAFSLEVEEIKDNTSKLWLADENANISPKPHFAQKGVMLNQGYYILWGIKSENNFADKRKVYNGFLAEGTLFFPNGKVKVKGFEDFKIFPNGWYMLEYKENKCLYTNTHQKVADNFIDCLTIGQTDFALRKDSLFYRQGDWELYSRNQKYLGSASNVVSFLGDKLILKETKEYGFYELTNLKNELIASNIIKYKSFYNQKFSLVFGNQSSAMYDKDGTRISTYTGKNAEFLPDGTFVSYRQNLLDTRYRSSGIMIKGEIYRCETLSNYFLLTKEKTTELYNDKGTIVDTDILIANECGNFALFQKEGRYHLYNQFGKVLEYNIV